MAGWDLFKEGDICKTLHVVLDDRTVFDYGDQVRILKVIQPQPAHPYKSYLVYSPLTGRNIELHEEELIYMERNLPGSAGAQNARASQTEDTQGKELLIGILLIIVCCFALIVLLSTGAMADAPTHIWILMMVGLPLAILLGVFLILHAVRLRNKSREQVGKGFTSPVAVREDAPSAGKVLARDKVGTRLDSFEKASIYWSSCMAGGTIPPFLDFRFSSESDCIRAITKLSFIVKAADTGELISLEPLYFGYFEVDPGKYEILVSGEALTYELFKESLTKLAEAGGVLKDKKEPKDEDNMIKKPASISSSVSFHHVEHKNSFTYYIYKGPNKEAAIEFLKNLEGPDEYFVYHIVESPDGNWCKDKDGLYKESPQQ